MGRFDYLQCGTDGVGRRVIGAGDHTVGMAGLNHQRSEVVGYQCRFLASSSVIPLDLRSSNNKDAYSSRRGDVAGLINSIPVRSQPFFAKSALIWASSPRIMILQILSLFMMWAALRTRRSSPSGRTMVCNVVWRAPGHL